jgi:ADP-ribosylglycohydrolase
MLGAIAGDVIGSVHESLGTKRMDFELFVPASRFTDDTVLAVAIADCLLHELDYVDVFHAYGQTYPDAGYGPLFLEWILTGDRRPYNSFGNGSAMRVPAVGYAFDSLERVLEEAARSAAVTHNHPEGITGAQATAGAIFLARQGETKAGIKAWVERECGYDLEVRLEDIRPHYVFDVTCQGTVPAALVAFLESTDYEDAVRKAISLGGDADTLACITGGIAEAHYGGVPPHILQPTIERLDPRLFSVVREFCIRHSISGLEPGARSL